MPLYEVQHSIVTPTTGDVLYYDATRSAFVNLPSGEYPRLLMAQGSGAAPKWGIAMLPNPIDERYHWIQATGANQTGFLSGMNSADVVDGGTTGNGDDADGRWVSITNVPGTILVARTSASNTVYDMRHNPQIEIAWKTPSTLTTGNNLFFIFSNGVEAAVNSPQIGIVSSAGNPWQLSAFAPAATPQDVRGDYFGPALAVSTAYRMRVRWDNATKTIYGSINGSRESSLDLSTWNGLQASYGWAVGSTLPSGQSRTMRFGAFLGRWRAAP